MLHRTPTCSTVTLFILVTATSMSQFIQERKNIDQVVKVILNISDQQKTQYFGRNFYSDTYKYGYDINSNGQFHYEKHDLEGVTYGCYGYVDSFDQLKATFYISDGWGYRVVQPGDDVELFLHKHDHHKYTNVHYHRDRYEKYGVVRSWRELYFPAKCAQYAEPNIPSPVKLSLDISKVPKYSKHFGKSSTLRTLDNPESSYLGHSGISKVFSIFNTPGIMSMMSRDIYLGRLKSFNAPETLDRPDTSLYPGYDKISNILTISGIIETSDKLSKQNTLSYPLYPGMHDTSDKPVSLSWKPGKPGYSSYYNYPRYSESSEGLAESEGPISGIGGTRNIGGTGGGGIDFNGLNVPTNLPGPNEPSSGDPDYIFGIKSTRKPLHSDATKNKKYKPYSFDIDNHNSIARYCFENKNVSSYIVDVKDIESTNRKKNYKEESIYNASEINSVLQTDSPSPLSLEYNVRNFYKTNIIRLPIRSYNRITHTDLQQIENLSKKKLESFSVPDRDRYQKTVFFPARNLQRQLIKDSTRIHKEARQENAFNVYHNFADVNSEPIFKIPFQSDLSSIVSEKHVNTPIVQSSRANPGFDALGVQPPSFIDIKFVPLSVDSDPDPQAYPYYLFEADNGTDITTGMASTSIIGYLGFIPIIFVPHYIHDRTDSIKIMVRFPSVTSIPCARYLCSTQNDKCEIKIFDVNQLGNVDYPRKALGRVNLDYLNIPLKTGFERKTNKDMAKENKKM